MDLILASASPRRKRLLEMLGIQFRVSPPNIDESLFPGEPPTEAAIRLAKTKAASVTAGLSKGIVLAADTLVEIRGELLGKPRDTQEVFHHLHLLSGQCHKVITGISLADAATNQQVSACEQTQVYFDKLSDATLDWYARTGEGLDKAGSYAIQGRASAFVRRIDGCYFNVVGLPLSRLRNLFSELGLNLFDFSPGCPGKSLASPQGENRC